MSEDEISGLRELLARERRGRLAAERLLSQKSRELSEANRRLADQARLLSDEVIVKREEVHRARSETEVLIGQNARVREDLERVSEKVVKAERRLWEALETIQDGFAVYNAKNQLVMANRAFMAMFEGVGEIAPGSRYADLLTLMAEEGLVDIGFEEPGTWIAKMLARWGSDPIEPAVMQLWNETHVKFIDRRSSDGDMVSLALNITETIRYEERLKAERERAEAASRAKSSFLANMSHEIRTPMNGVVGMAELLCESELSEEQRLYAETIRSSGETLLKIINDILDYSKIEAAKLTLRAEPFDLERMIHEVLLLLKPAAQKKGIDLMVDYDMFLPTHFSADPGRVRQILTNLVGNAVKFTPRGHVLVRVTGVPPDDPPGRQSLHVTVEDTGIGIPADKIEHIFGEFNQVEDGRNRAFEGTGLGLAITRELVQLMGGQIWVDSTEGEGSTFGFRLTLPTEEESAAAPAAPDLPFRSALVVEPQQINRVILDKQLATMGLRVAVRRSAEEALDKGVAGYDLVLLDDALPGSGVFDLAAAVRAADPAVPLIVLAEAPADLRGAIGAGTVTAFLQKPLLRRNLYTCIAGLARPRSERPAAPAAPPERRAGRRMRVLAAEDNRTNRLVFQKMVQDLEIELDFAEDGSQAVAAFRKQRPDLIFMDISMPRMDGKQAATEIRRLESESGAAAVPICALTAHAMDGDADDILAAGIDHYLTKPLRKDAITQMIARHCPQDAVQPVPGTGPTPAG